MLTREMRKRKYIDITPETQISTTKTSKKIKYSLNVEESASKQRIRVDFDAKAETTTKKKNVGKKLIPTKKETESNNESHNNENSKTIADITHESSKSEKSDVNTNKSSKKAECKLADKKKEKKELNEVLVTPRCTRKTSAQHILVDTEELYETYLPSTSNGTQKKSKHQSGVGLKSATKKDQERPKSISNEFINTRETDQINKLGIKSNTRRYPNRREHNEISSSSDNKSSHDQDSDIIHNGSQKSKRSKTISYTKSSVNEEKEEEVEVEQKEKVKKVPKIKSTKKSKYKMKFIPEKDDKNQSSDNLSIIEKISEEFDDAILKLQEYSLPNEIPCREAEKKTITEFIEEGLDNNGMSHCLYISGVPGIGKTVSLLEVVKQLKAKYAQTEKDFNFIHINGLNLKNPENIYHMILKEIVGIENVSSATACLILSDIFKKGTLPKAFRQYKLNNKIRVMLLDELDYLVTKDQNLLYNIFDWAHYKPSKLITIGIANTMDLPERLLSKITSRMGNRRLVYIPYTSQQIEKIVISRLEGFDIILPEAITFLSKKIATFSSDIRRTLHLCREALRLCKEEFDKNKENLSKEDEIDKSDISLKIEHIRKSYAQIYNSPCHECLPLLQEDSKLLLISISLILKNQGTTFTFLSEVYERFKTIQNMIGKRIMKYEDTKILLKKLVCLGLIQEKSKDWLSSHKLSKDLQIDPNAKKIYNIHDHQIILKISIDDITNGLKDDALFTKFSNLF